MTDPKVPSPSPPDPRTDTDEGARPFAPGSPHPRLWFHLVQPRAEATVFAPLTPPRDLEISAQDVPFSALEHARLRLEAHLAPGRRNVPLFDDRHFPVVVPEACRLRGWLTAGTVRTSRGGEPLVESAEFTFDPPLRLYNILQVLSRLHTLFEDRDLARLLRTVDRFYSHDLARRGRTRARRVLRKRVQPRLERWFPAEGRGRVRIEDLRRRIEEGTRRLRDRTEDLARVDLSRVVAQPTYNRGEWHLVLRFGGCIHWAEGLPFVFEEIRLPRQVLPRPYALLEKLLSDNPLATAALRRDRLHQDALLRVLLDAVTRFEGQVAVEGTPPGTALDFLMADHGLLVVDGASVGRVRVRAEMEGEVQAHELRVRSPSVHLEGDRLELDAEAEVRVRAEPPEDAAEPGPSVLEAMMDALWARQWPRDRLGVEACFHLPEPARLSTLQVNVAHHHPLLRGAADLRLRLEDVALSGRATLGAGAGFDPARQHLEADLEGRYDLLPSSHVTMGDLSLVPEILRGGLEGRVELDPEALKADLHLDPSLAVGGTTRLQAFPELDIDDTELRLGLDAVLEARLAIHARETAEGLYQMDFRGTTVAGRLDRLRFDLPPRSLVVPEHSRLAARVPAGVLDTSGLGRAQFEVEWDLRGASPLLLHPPRRVELFVPPLRQGKVTVGLGPTGRLTISGEGAELYDAHFFNALVNPQDEVDRWMEILDDDEALDHVQEALSLFNADWADKLGAIRRFGDRVKDVFRDEGIEEPRHLIPRPVIARVLSRVLAEDDSLARRIEPLVEDVTEARGLDVRGVRRILDEVLPEHDYDYELDRGLRWLARLLRPMDPLPPRRRETCVPLAEDPALQAPYEGIPTASEIYAGLAAGDGPEPAFTRRVARVAPYLSLEQVEWIAARLEEGWCEEDRLRLRNVLDLKQRIRRIQEGYGGFGFAPQARAISLFLGAAIDLTARDRRAASTADLRVADAFSPHISRSLLGPEDVAVLLQAGLTNPVQGRVVQLNQRMLLDLVFRQPAPFAMQVVAELGREGARALAGTLNALLEVEQAALKDRLDVAVRFSEALSLDLPRLEDYLAGGRFAARSYIEDLNRVAETLLEQAAPYLALNSRLREDRRPPAPPPAWEPPLELLAQHAQEAIRDADALGGRCRFQGREPARRRRAREAYEAAFQACRALQQQHPGAFCEPWFKAFWQRNHEALVVLSVVRNVQEDVDRVRRWLRIRTGKPVPTREQELVDTVIDVLYHFEEDREALRRDPLVRLLIDPPPGRYDFTIISCMGVITEGAEGRELEAAYQRLWQRRGIRTIRADTANVRSLDYNAARVEEAVRKATTPWGWIGYSQGCANGLMAEARLKSGTPDQQRLLAGLRCRNFLFSAVNGSAHGTLGDRKFLEAMVEGDHFLAHYQARFSNPAIQLALRSLRLLLDSESVVLGLGGTRSLSYQGVVPLGRDGQFAAHIPSSLVRGVVDRSILPEALEFLYNVLTEQIESPLHDTQVYVDDAVGHPAWIDTPWSRELRRCDMGCRVQSTHHWSPLRETTAFITTQRDEARAVYEQPKDRHVFPWVEVNARFGIVEPAGNRA